MANTTNLDLVKPLGTDHALISVINGNMDKVDAYAGKVNDSLAGIQDGLAIVAVGDTHAAITSGQFVYVKEHNTLPEGLYTASANIAANGALSTTNLTADSKGGLNALSDQIESINTPVVLRNQSQIDAWCQEISGKYSGFGIAFLRNDSKDDVFTNRMDKSDGVLLLFESDGLWANHPYYLVISGGASFTGIANVQTTGVTLVTAQFLFS